MKNSKFNWNLRIVHREIVNDEFAQAKEPVSSLQLSESAESAGVLIDRVQADRDRDTGLHTEVGESAS